MAQQLRTLPEAGGVFSRKKTAQLQLITVQLQSQSFPRVPGQSLLTLVNAT